MFTEVLVLLKGVVGEYGPRRWGGGPATIGRFAGVLQPATFPVNPQGKLLYIIYYCCEAECSWQ
jgi:hypothetical protein